MATLRPITNVNVFAQKQSMKLSEKALERKTAANVFVTKLADGFLFMSQIVRAMFTRHFEWKEFFLQCFQIGNKSLPLISITGAIMGLEQSIVMGIALAFLFVRALSESERQSAREDAEADRLADEAAAR